MKNIAFTILILAHFLSAAAGDFSNKDCVYTLYVKTGSTIKAGTDSKIGLKLGDPSGKSVWIPDLERMGANGSQIRLL
ncbi:PLAT domain-containing protein [Quillaja saponaria]|uniref:PLAT domain-containing protein n=1 Tax=Quillaja saponaria TaxID=32244 RepID=A0AAD7QJG6_QUISA|nr:PLAT domain-containing protein [Quillaja saponaria]